MRFRGSFKGIQRDWQTNTPLITFSLTEGNIDEVNDLIDIDLCIEAKRYKKKRSLNANAYMWELIGKIATHSSIKSSPQEVYEGFIQDMRLPMLDDDGGYIMVTVLAKVDMSKITGHWCFYMTSPDGRFISYYLLRGSSTFDSKEMSQLIDLVVDEAKQLGIETLTPTELAKMEGYVHG